ncbi:MAG: hypothetical protein DMF69_04855 [Acidobacteria bacterium]|nr:MAG: hypothetical protein DMF69_04855 [Acidobacteriota bacterium]
MKSQSERRWVIKYSILTIALALPLLWSFRWVRNYYPATVWDMMLASDLETRRRYCVLRGETVSGKTIEIRPTELVNATYARTWTMVNFTIDNRSLSLPSPHPDNAVLLNQFGGVGRLPPGVRIPDLLNAWANLYNKRLPGDSPDRLKAIRLDQYEWPGGRYADYSNYLMSWRKDL